MASRLLSIDLQGYKTFANRFRFDFPGVITCVVGPNGSGKSNVADAIRWVMGEQSFNLLRARKTEDLIFSGSASRPRAGMASVSIVFNNEDGWFPLDYSEISISRRAYRDGQNEYFLNNQKVRLKEITELLSQSGVTPRTYTIIGQGLVDAALSLRPDERRQFFEEAAGISLHRKRREEALNRLDTTRRNLDRVADILSELKPRLVSLEKQASRVIEQERIKGELGTLMKEWYGYHWHRAQNELQRSREILRSQEERLSGSKELKEKSDSSYQAIQATLHSARSDLGGWHAESAELHRQLEAVNRSMAVAEERQRSIQEQSSFIVTDLARIDEEVKVIGLRMAEDTREKQDVLNDKQELGALLQEAEGKLVKILTERGSIQAEKDRAEKEYNRLEAEKVRIHVQLQETEGRITSLEPLKRRLVTDREDAAGQLAALQDGLAKLDQEIEGLRHDIRNQEETGARLAGEQAELRSSLEKTNRTLGQLENEKTRKSSQRDIYQSSIRSNEHLSADARTFLKKARNQFKDLPVQNLLSQFIVDEGYDRAIAAGLGEYLEAFLLGENADVDQLLDFITEKEVGRIVLFSAGAAQAQAAWWNANRSQGVLGTALEFVRFPSGERHPVIETLLSDVVIVTDRRAALELKNAIPKHGCVVTLNGEVFRGNQAIISGKDQRGGYFEIQRRLESLGAEIDRLEKQIAMLAAEQKSCQQSISEKVRQYKEHGERLQGLEQKVNGLTQQRNKMTLQAEQHRNHIQYLDRQLTGLEEQRKDAEKRIGMHRKQLGEVEEQARQTFANLERRLAALQQLGEEEVQHEINHWRTKMAVLENSIREFDRRITLEFNRQQDLGKQKQFLEQRLETMQVENGSIRAKFTHLIERQEDLNAALAQLNEKIEPVEQVVLSLEKELQKGGEEQTLLQQRLTMAERYVTQAQLDLSRRNDELDKLREKIEDDFGLVHLEYRREITGPTPLPFDGLVDQLPMVKDLSSDLEDTIKRQKALLRRMGPLNPEARTEYESVRERFDHLTNQMTDLEKADQDLREIIRELDEIMRREFQATFKRVAQEFKEMFSRLFGGGSARLVLLDEENLTEAGIEIEAQLPGKRKQGLAVLSGGERSLTAVALIFALLKVSPTPFCVLDEVDAALDEANVGRFGELLRELSTQTQFIVITHNRNTVQLADVIYGVTMSRDSTSQVISLKMDEVSEVLVN